MFEIVLGVWVLPVIKLACSLDSRHVEMGIVVTVKQSCKQLNLLHMSMLKKDFSLLKI